MLKDLVDKFSRAASVYAKDNAMITEDYDPADYLNSMGAAENAENRIRMGSALETFKSALISENIEENLLFLSFMDLVNGHLKATRKDFFNKFNADADDEVLVRLYGYNAGHKSEASIAVGEIPKEELFEDKLDELQRLYFGDVRQRVLNGLNYQRQLFADRIEDYVTGKSDTLDVKDITDSLKDRSMGMARFIARDESSRFNKALTITSLTQAGATKVRWATCRDSRVRDSHRRLDGKEFPIDALPPETYDFNCRCGLVPTEFRN